jgi:hypothetical protein
MRSWFFITGALAAGVWTVSLFVFFGLMEPLP